MVFDFDLSPRKIKSLLAGWLAAAFILIAVGPASAWAIVHSSIVVDAETGAVLESHNADRQTYPASLTKLMTLYLTFQQLSSGKMTLGQQLQVSSHAARQSPTKLWLHVGSKISVESAILAITTRSANDAAVALAEAIGGSEWKFAEIMNREARLLGLNETTFCNASGLPNPRQKTTARDMAKLGLAILHDYPQYYHYFKEKSFVFRGRRIRGHDRLLGRYPGVDGMKTGYTSASGYNLVTSSVRNGRRLVGVVMGGRSAHSRDRQMMALLNRGFSKARSKTLLASAEEPPAPESTQDKYVNVADDDPGHSPLEASSDKWIVQIGGEFHSSRSVRGALTSASHTVPDLLGDATPLVVKLRGRRYYARFTNLNEHMAFKTCRELRRKKFSCKILHIESSEATVASAGR